MHARHLEWMFSGFALLVFLFHSWCSVLYLTLCLVFVYISPLCFLTSNIQNSDAEFMHRGESHRSMTAPAQAGVQQVLMFTLIVINKFVNLRWFIIFSFGTCVINMQNLKWLTPRQITPEFWSSVRVCLLSSSWSKTQFILSCTHTCKSPECVCCALSASYCDVKFLNPSSTLFSMSPWLLLPHKNASAGLSFSHWQYIMPPHFITIKGLTCRGPVKVIGGEAGRHVAELSFPLSVDHISSASASRVTNHPASCGGRGAGCGDTRGTETNLKPLGRPAVDLHNSICSIHSTGRDATSLSHFLLSASVYPVMKAVPWKWFNVWSVLDWSLIPWDKRQNCFNLTG